MPASAPATIRFLFRDYARKVGNDPRVLAWEPHSLPLQIASEEGLVGIIGWIGAGILLIRIGRTARITRTPIGRAIVIAIGTYLTASLFLHGSELRQLYMLVGLLVAFAGAPDERLGSVGGTGLTPAKGMLRKIVFWFSGRPGRPGYWWAIRPA